MTAPRSYRRKRIAGIEREIARLTATREALIADERAAYTARLRQAARPDRKARLEREIADYWGEVRQ